MCIKKSQHALGETIKIYLTFEFKLRYVLEIHTYIHTYLYTYKPLMINFRSITKNNIKHKKHIPK